MPDGAPADGGPGSGAPGSGMQGDDWMFPADQRAAVYRVIEERRDVRRGFRSDPDTRGRPRTRAGGGAPGAVGRVFPAVGLHRDQRPGQAGADQGPGYPEPGGLRLRAARCPGQVVRPAEDRGHTPDPGQHRGDLRSRPGAAGTPSAGTRSRRRRRTQACSRWPTCGSRPGPRGSASAGSAFSASASSPASSACPPTWRWSRTCASGTSANSGPSRSSRSPAGRGAGRSAGRCTPRSTAGGRCPAGRPSACWTRCARRSGRPTPTRWPPPGSGRRS